MSYRIAVSVILLFLLPPPVRGQEETPNPTIVLAEGEQFRTDKSDWTVCSQSNSYADQTFGGMWSTHGGLLRAPAESANSTAVQTVKIPEAGEYRVWSKYQCPPYFHYMHRVEVWQRGRRLFSHDYGKLTAKRLYSFFGKTTYGLPAKSQVWFPWGVDHDAAEAPSGLVKLEAGTAEIRLVSLPNPAPAGDRFVDFVLLTTSPDDTCEGWEKWGQAKSPFMFEAIHSTPIYLRFRNSSREPVRARLHTNFGHFTWHCAPKSRAIPDAPVLPGQWSPWININQVVELFTDEGLQVNLVQPDGGTGKNFVTVGGSDLVIPVQVARDSLGRQLLGDLGVPNGETIHFPIDLVWNPESRLRLSRDIAKEFIESARKDWRRASPNKPRYIPIYGSFSRGERPWATELKDALGYNTQLPDGYEHMAVDGYHQHLRNPDQIRKYAMDLGAKRRQFRVCSLGDEISLGGIDLQDEKYIEPFRRWLQKKKLTRDDLLVDPSKATLTGNNRLKWYARQFSAEQRFAVYAEMTRTAEQAFGPQVRTGANFSPHHGVMYYGDQEQWIDAFKHRAMSMFWTEDYIFFVPELPQTISFLMARARCAVKYHELPIHMYVMPHAPGQPADYFYRNVLTSIGAGASHLDHFWVAPQEQYSENYVSWRARETFQAIYESNFDIASVESLLQNSAPRQARVAVITGKATAVNEDAAPVNMSADRFLRMSHLAGKPVQNICRKDQSLIYLALRQAQYDVDLITEDDIWETDALDQYQAVYFAGEWIDQRIIPRLEQWVKTGGILYASTGLGHRNQYNEPETAFHALLGIHAEAPRKNLYHHRPLLELPLADPLTVSHPDDLELEAIAFHQPISIVAEDARAVVRWQDGSPAVTERPLGRGRVYAVGTAIGAAFWKSGLRPVPWARGGRVNLYNPDEFSEGTRKLIGLGAESALISREAVVSVDGVERWILDHRDGSLLTLVNWTNQDSLEGVKVNLRLKQQPKRVYSVNQQQELPFTWERNRVQFRTDLGAADFLMITW